VHITEIHESDDDFTEGVNLNDYHSDDFESTFQMPTWRLQSRRRLAGVPCCGLGSLSSRDADWSHLLATRLPMWPLATLLLPFSHSASLWARA